MYSINLQSFMVWKLILNKVLLKCEFIARGPHTYITKELTMVKNYTCFFCLIALFTVRGSYSQEIRIFNKEDFDLRGDVKSCLVITDYGKEEYDFDEMGRLTKSVTRYNDYDYDITYYKYGQSQLLEKRLENYRENAFDSATSMAHFYEVDTTNTKIITEKIVSYEKEFLDKNQYFYDTEDRVTRIVRTNNDGTDETIIEYSVYKDEETKTYILNGLQQKSIRTSTRKAKSGSNEKVVLTKKFLNGNPLEATEEIVDASNKLVSTTYFNYDPTTKQFAKTRVVSYTYDETGALSKTVERKDDVESAKEYIYQYDNGEQGNWVKQIITPGNAYTTRRIKYYDFPEETNEE